MTTVILNGKCVSATGQVAIQNMVVQNGKITGLGYIPDEDEASITQINLEKHLILPATSDFLRAPERHAATEAIAAAHQAGIRYPILIPNDQTTVFDTPADIQAYARCVPDTPVMASVSRGNGVTHLSELATLKAAGAAGFYIGRIHENEGLLAQALMWLNTVQLPIIVGPLTCFDRDATHLNEGIVSFEIGVKGELVVDEWRRVQTILTLMAHYCPKIPVHFLAISSPQALASIHRAKAQNPGITVGVSPVHMIATDAALVDYNPAFKFNPPLRSAHERDGLFEALKTGMVDHLPSLHAFSPLHKQPVPFIEAPMTTQTVSVYYALVGHVLLAAGLGMDQWASLVGAPSAWRHGHQTTIGLNRPATFLALPTVSPGITNQMIWDTFAWQGHAVQPVSIQKGMRV